MRGTQCTTLSHTRDSVVFVDVSIWFDVERFVAELNRHVIFIIKSFKIDIVWFLLLHDKKRWINQGVPAIRLMYELKQNI
jgi:hypothetical protein